MGEVYRARDTRLGRDVAIKVLPEFFTTDPQRLARFEREARVLATLNHPHIGAIYGLEESGDVRALVLELVEGSTLAGRLGTPVPVEEMLIIARQIAEALEAAHDKGIIHRDLKPANIAITPDGRVKVLDFGLAKAPTDEATASQSPTETGPASREGTVIGTAAYMSPEQSRGRTVDKRTDIWAFGCIVYELLSGKHAFAADTLSDTIVAVLERPPDWGALPDATPPRLRRLLERCLEKDLKRRFHDIADVRLELEDAVAQPDASTFPTIDRKGASRGRRVIWPAAVVISVVVAAALLVPILRQTPASTQGALRAAVILPPDQALVRTKDRAYPLAISADGTRIAYVAERDGHEQLYLRELSSFEASALPGTDGASQPFFSPDGRSIAYFARGALERISVAGGAPFRICDVAGVPVGGSWGADDLIVLATLNGMSRVSAVGGKPVPIAESAGAAWPDILPDGKSILFTGKGAMAIMPLDGGAKRVIARTNTSTEQGPILLGTGALLQARYVPSGHIVYGQDPGSVRVLPFDFASLTVKGVPVSVVDSAFRSMSSGVAYFAASKNGLLLYAPENPRRQLVWVDRGGRATPISSDRQAFRFARISPDGKRIVVAIDSELRRSDLWIYDAERGGKTRLTSDGGITPAWTPDGTRVSFLGQGALSVQAASATGNREVLLPGPPGRYPSSWSPDGRSLLFHTDNPATSMDLWVVSNDAGHPARPLIVSPFSELWAQFSRDGRWVTYVSDESGRYEVYVMRYPELDGKVPISTDGGSHPQWSHNMRELFYRRGSALMAVTIDTNRGFRAETPRLLFSDGRYVGAGGDLTFDVAPTDDRFLMIQNEDAAASRQLHLVYNWIK
jgi:Tol biopolymer transport system component